MSLLNKIDHLIKESESILANLLIFADFNLLNSQARAYNILNATVSKFKADIDTGYIVENISKEERKRIYLYKIMVLKNLIKYSKNYLKSMILDMSEIKYAYIDKKILYFFLYFVWQTEFMRNTLVYESIDEIQEERINICKKLISLDTT